MPALFPSIWQKSQKLLPERYPKINGGFYRAFPRIFKSFPKRKLR